jgi:uncharacterized protein (DUF2147 family)
MRLKFLSIVAWGLMPFVANAAMPFTGFYQTIDDETKTPKSIVALYEYRDGDDMELAGRIVALYGADGIISETLSNPTRVAENVSGAPKMVGMDIVWNMEWDNDDYEYEDGKIMDPKSGKVYSSVIWKDKKNPSVLNVRGKIGPFGRTQNWNVLTVSELPADLQDLDVSGWMPKVIKK